MDNKYRVRHSERHKQLMDRLTTRRNEFGVFSSYARLLVFSAALGYRESRRHSFKESGEPISLAIFKEEDVAFMYAIALAEMQDTACFQEGKFLEVMNIFEEYANAGLDYLERVLADDLSIHTKIEELLLDEMAAPIIPDLRDITA